MKKLIIPLIIFVITIILIPYSMAKSKAVVNTEAVRVREKASTDSDIVTVLYEDDECEIIEESGEWYKIKYGDNVGYAKSEFFTTDKTSSTTNKTNTVTEENVVENPVTTTAPANTEINTDVTSQTDASTTSIPPAVDSAINNTTTQNNQEISLNQEYVINNNIGIRNLPSVLSSEQSVIPQGTKIKVDYNVNNWYQISVNNIDGWITKEKLQNSVMPVVTQTPVVEQTLPIEQPADNTNVTEESNAIEEKNTENTSVSGKTGVVNVDTARVRDSASTSSEVIGTLDMDETIEIISEEGNFYKFKNNSISGYISKDLITIKSVTSRSSTIPRENDVVPNEINDLANNALSNNTDPVIDSVAGSSVIEFARQYLGYPYVLGASSPEKGFDCSGFTKFVFSNFGVSLGSTAASQSGNGVEVSRENLVPGDLILFYDDAMTKIGHVGIYIGDGDFIHSANPKRGVVIDNINTSTYYNTRYISARRLL